MKPSLTIAGITADPSLETEIVSGADGLQRPVFWAHSCEIEEPSRWLQPHELLMTVGHCVPSGSEAQRQFIISLDEAGLAGIAIGQDGIAPHLTKALFEESEERGFPVLRTSHRIPFAAISRMVAFSNTEKQTVGVLRLAKLYQVSAQRDMVQRRSGEPLSELFNTSITVVDDETGCVVIGNGVLTPEKGRRFSLRSTVRPMHLMLLPSPSLDGFSLGHLSQVLQVDANEITQLALDKLRTGIDLFTRVLAGRTGAEQALAERWGTDEPDYRMIATTCAVKNRVPLAVTLSGSAALTKIIDGYQMIAVPAQEEEALKELCAELGLRCGVSRLYHDPGDFSGAFEEATSEYRLARIKDQSWRQFTGEQVALLARSKSERRQIVESVLGPLAGDDPAVVPLRETLFVFLDHNQNWKETAAALHLHRQSVVYRLRRVEEITGRDIHLTRDIAEFWLARTSWEQYQIDLED